MAPLDEIVLAILNFDVLKVIKKCRYANKFLCILPVSLKLRPLFEGKNILTGFLHLKILKYLRKRELFYEIKKTLKFQECFAALLNFS